MHQFAFLVSLSFVLPVILAIAIPFIAVLVDRANVVNWRSLTAGQRKRMARAGQYMNGAIRSFGFAGLCLAGVLMAKAPAAAAPQNAAASNAQARLQILGSAVEMTQQIFSTNVVSLANGANVVTLNPRNVGLIKKFIVEVTGSVTTVVADALTLTDFGVANLLSNVVFTDLNNNQRINTSGWHLAMLNSYKKHFPYLGASSFGSVGTSVQDGLGGGSPVFGVVLAPPTQAASVTQTVRFVYDIPLAYSDQDLRGAIYANVVNATMQLQLAINPASIVVNTADSTFAVYTDSQAVPAGTTLNNVNVTVYQVYLDQLPVKNGQVILPILDLSTVYEMKTTTFTGVVVNQDFPMPYSNFRDFLSTCAIYNNGTAAGSTGRTAGTDVAYWALQSANFTNIWKKDPLLAAQHARDILKTDFAKGAYYFKHAKPISTTQYGNMELILNASTVGSTSAYVSVGWEDFAFVNTLTQAGSLAA